MKPGEALEIVRARSVQEEHFKRVELLLVMAIFGLGRGYRVCVRWRRRKPPHGDRRYKAAMRIIRAEWNRELREAPAGKWQSYNLHGARIE